MSRRHLHFLFWFFLIVGAAGWYGWYRSGTTGAALVYEAQHHNCPWRWVVMTPPAAAGQTATPVRVRAEMTYTKADHERGLMFRTALADDAGMLFQWDTADDRYMWMKNTYLPLDMIFARQGQVIGVVADAAPQTLEARGVHESSDAVLEVNAGFARRNGIGAGWHFSVGACLPAPAATPKP